MRECQLRQMTSSSSSSTCCCRGATRAFPAAAAVAPVTGRVTEARDWPLGPGTEGEERIPELVAAAADLVLVVFDVDGVTADASGIERTL